MWGLIGKQPIVPSAGQDARIPVFGSLDPLSGRLITQIAERKNSSAFIDHLRALLRIYNGLHIFLFLDNCSIHHAKAVARFLADHKDRIPVIWNAAYAPELNLIERYWGHLKAKAIHNYFFETKFALETAIRDAVRDLNHSNSLQTLVRLDFLRATRKIA